jgi:hypothetical protein
LFRGRPDKGKGITTDTSRTGFNHTERRNRGDGGIDGIATGLQYR